MMGIKISALSSLSSQSINCIFCFRLRSLVAVVPNAVGEPLHVEPVEVLVGVEPFHVVLLHSLVVPVLILKLGLLVVVLVVHRFLLQVRVLLVELLHHLEVHGVVDLEALSLDLLLPVLVVDLHVVENRVDEHSDVWVLVREQL